MITNFLSKLKKVNVNYTNLSEVKLPDMEYYFISGLIPFNFGGLTKSLLLRMKMFGEVGVNTTFVTYRFDPNFKFKLDQIIRQKMIDPSKSTILNMIEDFLIPNSGNKRVYEEFAVGKKVVNINDINIIENEIRTKKYDEFPSLIQYIDVLNEAGHIIKREEYNVDGALCRIMYYLPGKEAPYHEEYVKNHNEIYLEKMFNTLKKNNPTININWYSNNGIKSFNRKTDLRQYWIEFIQKRNDQKKFFLVDSRHQDEHLFRVKKDSTSYYAAFIHSRHYSDTKYKLQKRFEELCKHIGLGKIDCVFFITEDQKKDFGDFLGKQHCFYFTPHTHKKGFHPELLREEVDHKKAVIISRLVQEKNLTDAIKAFRIVVDHLPDVRLEIFGSGEEEEKLQHQICSLNLENHVLLKGFTADPDKEFQTAKFSISTSHSEGLPLSIIESIYNYCPVVSYDFDYGPNDLVHNGVNGFLVKQYDVQELADRMITLFQEKKKYLKMVKNCRPIAEKYSHNSYYYHWEKALNEVVYNRPKVEKIKKTLEKITCNINDVIVDQSRLILLFEWNQKNIDLNKYTAEIVGIDRRHSAELLAAQITDNKVEFNLLDTKLKEKLKCYDTEYVDFYMKMHDRDEEHIEAFKRLSLNEEVEFEKINHRISYATVNGDYSWKL
ncbi:alpha-glucosyltransferase N-terminal domain-containing protein [Bacillus sp. FJAT-53060]|uniref:glycosyltransferase n=1 Tax=Bacillus TaxID=1386 RepID=UPI001CFB4B88|nr:alpha-glucosyltransferase N-terminal domain-containing protein [Bacillus stratosphericus]